MKELKNVTMEITIEELENVTGGTVNKNPTPNNVGSVVDMIINGKNYDAIAQAIANLLNPEEDRTRKVNNNVDIYDCEI